MITLDNGIAYSENGDEWKVINYNDLLNIPKSVSELICFWSIIYTEPRNKDQSWSLKEDINYTLKAVNDVMMLSHRSDEQAMMKLKLKLKDLNNVKEEIKKKQQLQQKIEQELLEQIRALSNRIKGDINDMEEMEHELEHEFEL